MSIKDLESSSNTYTLDESQQDDRLLSKEVDPAENLEGDYLFPRTAILDPRTISDATLGLSDGLTVPFALTAGLSALGNTRLVIFGGLAELIAGAISMGLGGYLGAMSEA